MERKFLCAMYIYNKNQIHSNTPLYVSIIMLLTCSRCMFLPVIRPSSPKTNIKYLMVRLRWKKLPFCMNDLNPLHIEVVFYNTSSSTYTINKDIIMSADTQHKLRNKLHNSYHPHLQWILKVILYFYALISGF